MRQILCLLPTQFCVIVHIKEQGRPLLLLFLNPFCFNQATGRTPWTGTRCPKTRTRTRTSSFTRTRTRCSPSSPAEPRTTMTATRKLNRTTLTPQRRQSPVHLTCCFVSPNAAPPPQVVPLSSPPTCIPFPHHPCPLCPANKSRNIYLCYPPYDFSLHSYCTEMTKLGNKQEKVNVFQTNVICATCAKVEKNRNDNDDFVWYLSHFRSLLSSTGFSGLKHTPSKNFYFDYVKVSFKNYIWRFVFHNDKRFLERNTNFCFISRLYIV